MRPSRRAVARLVAFVSAGLLASLWAFGLLGRFAASGRDHVRVDLRALGAFPLDARGADNESVPADRRQLDGRKVVMVGEMFAPTASGRVSDSQLVHDTASRGPPRVQERVFATVPPELSVRNLTGRTVEVRGTLHVGIERSADGEAVSLFRITVDRVDEFSGPAPRPDVPADLAAWLCAGMTALCLGGAGWVAWTVWTVRRRDRPRPPGRCARCGYDLRGSVERCPECGTFFRRRQTT